MMNFTRYRRQWPIAALLGSVAAVSAGCDLSPAGHAPPPAAVNGSRPEAEVSEAAPPSAGKASAAAAKEHRDHDLHVKEPFDPVRENGEFFVGWPKPKLALVITGHQDGYVEPCGCAGLENMKGGLSRRHTFFKQLAERGWPLAAVDVGGIVRRFGKQAEFQFNMTAEALRKMNYQAVGFGPADLRLSTGDVVAAVAGAEPEDSIFVSANVSLFGLTPKVRLVKAGGMKLGITSVLGDKYQQEVNNSEVEMRPPTEALAEVVPQLEGCDVRILLAHATIKEAEALARQFPQFNLVVVGESADVPPAQPEKVEGTSTWLIEPGQRGMYAIVAGFYDDKVEPIRFQRVALDSRYQNSDAMKQLMVDYQDQLRQLGWEGLGLRPVAAPEAKKGSPLAGKFVGTASCKECHESEYDVWAASAHAHATETLVKADPPRQFDAECISCHATGWNAQEFFPYVTGFESLDKTPHLVGNGCENCHGPGAAHVAAENGNDETARGAARQLLKLTWPEAKETACVKCHDHDNSPEFDKNAERYWSEIEH